MINIYHSLGRCLNKSFVSLCHATSCSTSCAQGISILAYTVQWQIIHSYSPLLTNHRAVNAGNLFKFGPIIRQVTLIRYALQQLCQPAGLLVNGREHCIYLAKCTPIKLWQLWHNCWKWGQNYIHTYVHTHSSTYIHTYVCTELSHCLWYQQIMDCWHCLEVNVMEIAKMTYSTYPIPTYCVHTFKASPTNSIT